MTAGSPSNDVDAATMAEVDEWLRAMLGL